MEDNINYVDKYVEVISLINETQKYRFFIYVHFPLIIYLFTLLFDMLHSNRRPWDWLIYSRFRIQRFTLGACWEREPSAGFMRQPPSICDACVAQQLLP